MKVRVWGKIGENAQTIRLIAGFSDLPSDAAMARVFVRIPELSDQEYYGEVEVYTKGVAEINIPCPCDEPPVVWSEFTPKQYEVQFRGDVVRALEKAETFAGTASVSFSMFRPVGTQFTVNGQPLFIRGISMPREQLEARGPVKVLLADLKKRGLNCLSIGADCVTEELLEAADSEGVYLKVEGVVNRAQLPFAGHPSLVMTGLALEGGSDMTVPWMEFAVRDRQDYSDAPDTRSDHREDVYGQDDPTLLTHVGERRAGETGQKPASMYLAQICCREEMEAALRTPSFGGYILHSDAAVMGLSPRRMREFAGPLVPLLMMKKYVWSTDETLVASVLIANYSDQKYFERISITATDESGQRYTKMSNRIRIGRGSLVSTGEVEIPMDQFTPGQSIELQVSIDETEYRNHYTIWLFSDSISVKVPPHVHVTRHLDERAQNLLANGKKVVYIPKLNRLPFDPGWFSPLASQVAAHREKVVASGLECRNEHGMLKGFPTEEIGDYQWWNLVHNSTPIPVRTGMEDGCVITMPTPEGDRVLLGECLVGEGKLIYTSIDLLIQLDRPEARQLYAGLLQYAASNRFRPSAQLSFEELQQWMNEK